MNVSLSSIKNGAGFNVFNINSSSLTRVGQNLNLYAAYNASEKMLISGNQAFVACGSYGLQIVNISNPANPSQSSSFNDLGLSGNYGSVGVTGDLLCASDGNNFKVFDVSQLSKPPALVGPVNAIGAGVIVAASGIAYVGANDGIRLYSLATPSAPQLKYTIPSSVVSPYEMQLVGTTLYVSGMISGTARFAAIDVSNPSTYSVRGTKDFTGSFNGWSLAVNGNKALVGLTGTNRISILDISNINSPVERGSIAVSGYSHVRISPDGNYAYSVEYGTSGFIHVINISNLANPLTVANVPIDTAPGVNMDLRGNELYVGTGKGLYVFDISNPASPVLTRSYLMTGIYYIGRSICAPTESANQSASIYVADEDGGVVALQEQDIQVPNVYITDPIFGSTWPTPTSSTELGGGSDDNVGVTAITWSNNRGGSGQVSPPLENWYVPSIALYPGTNILTVTAYDAVGNTGTDSLAVIYQTANQNQMITFPAIANHTFGDAPIMLEAAASSGLPVNFSVISGPAILTSSNVLSLTGAGAVIVEANQFGSDFFNPAAPVDVSFNVSRANQAIDFAPLPDKSAGDPPFALSAATSSGLPVYFSIVSGPATINSNVVTLAGGGMVAVQASQPGNSNYNAAATIQRSFNVSKVPQTIAFGALSPQKVGDAPFPLTATASSGLAVRYSISGPATLSGNIVTLTGYGTVSVTASQAGNSMYAAAESVTQAFLVAPPTGTVVDARRFADGRFQMGFYGLMGSNYTLQGSINLSTWVPLLNFTCTNSPTYIMDSGAGSLASRFYRVVQ